MLTRVLCATDRSELSPKIYRHAAGLAAAWGATLSLVHVGDGEAPEGTVARIRDEYTAAMPYTSAYEVDPQIFTPAGKPVGGILLTADALGADLIVCGSRRRGTVTSWLLGSTSRALLEATSIPMLVIPDTELDVVSVGQDHPQLHFGAVITALDPAESNRAQLALAAAFAQRAAQPLSLLTVIAPGDSTTLEQANQQLRERAHGLTPGRPTGLIVRRGEVAEQIVQCCLAERAGLVVMGLRAKGRGTRPGAIAAAVLARGQAAVVAVPDVAA